MQIVKTTNDPAVVQALKSGKIVVLRTDTLYGILAQADDQQAVQRVYDIKHRNQAKSPIVLVSDKQQLYDQPSPELEAVLQGVWPGKVSVIMPSANAPVWIRRDNDSVAYRMPDKPDLIDLISQTGRLIAPSANPEGLDPAMTIDQAIEYFGDQVDIYIDGGMVSDDSPSQLLQVLGSGEIERLR